MLELLLYTAGIPLLLAAGYVGVLYYLTKREPQPIIHTRQRLSLAPQQLVLPSVNNWVKGGYLGQSFVRPKYRRVNYIMYVVFLTKRNDFLYITFVLILTDFKPCYSITRILLLVLFSKMMPHTKL